MNKTRWGLSIDATEQAALGDVLDDCPTSRSASRSHADDLPPAHRGGRGRRLRQAYAPVVVHRPSKAGGPRVGVRREGFEEFLGTAYSDHDVVDFLEAAGVTDPENVLDDRLWGEWPAVPAYQWATP
ncbi:hypothetical protein ACIQ7S_20500 [Streptomyces griseoluteus]|uniref:hypothetical protein n=1 Tax=Streptomyces griseoluteus TaxID=29306 RepID=UPI003319BE7C